MPCPHYDIRIVQRRENESAVAAAAYQSGDKLFSEYDQEQKYYSHKSEIVHREIMLPPHAPSECADRNTLWNAAEAVEKQWNSQLARRVILAIPRELPPEQYTDLLRDYCREFFVSKGMVADFAIHDKGDGNPHAHILLTMRVMDENGKWLPKSRKVYDLDENGERIRLASGRWKSHKQDTVDWNDQGKAELWRKGWSDTVNRYLEAAGRTERLDLRSYARQGIDSTWRSARKNVPAGQQKCSLKAASLISTGLKRHLIFYRQGGLPPWRASTGILMKSVRKLLPSGAA